MEVVIMFMEDKDKMRLQACRRGREIEKYQYLMDLKECPPVQSAQTNLSHAECNKSPLSKSRLWLLLHV